MKINIYFLISFFLLILFSCNNDEKVFQNYQNRIVNISTLSQSLKNTDNEYLKTLIDSIKIIQNEFSVINPDLKFKNELDNNIKLIESNLKRKISQNCILNKTFEIEIDTNDKIIDFEHRFNAIRLIFFIKKNNNSEVRLDIKSEWEDWDRYSVGHFLFKFINTKKEDFYIIKFVNEMIPHEPKGLELSSFAGKGLEEEVIVNVNYEIYNDTTFKININKDHPLFLKVNDLNDCECELIK
jgi:hypothetical protein